MSCLKDSEVDIPLADKIGGALSYATDQNLSGRGRVFWMTVIAPTVPGNGCVYDEWGTLSQATTGGKLWVPSDGNSQVFIMPGSDAGDDPFIVCWPKASNDILSINSLPKSWQQAVKKYYAVKGAKSDKKLLKRDGYQHGDNDKGG
jgi:hypothetical protein